jgi:hypothetical protein
MKKFLTSFALVVLMLAMLIPAAYASGIDSVSSAPLVYTSAGISCNVGDTAVISVTATATDGGTLSYQWYRSLDGTNSNGTMIVTATGSNYYADTTTAGTNYYFCVVTSSTAYGNCAVISAPISVTVQQAQAPVIQGIGVLTLPNKTTYTEGDTLEPAGLSVRVWTDQGTYDVTGGLECSPANLDIAGTQTITVRYEGKVCTFTVTVEAAKEVVQSISIASLPTKTTYTVGDTLDSTGLTVRVVTNKQVVDISDGFSYTPKVLTGEGTQQIKVIYNGVNCTFNVTVEPKSTPSPSPSPTPTASPSPSVSPSVSPSPTSNVINHQSHQSSAGSAVLQIVLVLALLGLVGVGAYVYTVQRKAKSNPKDNAPDDDNDNDDNSKWRY